MLFRGVPVMTLYAFSRESWADPRRSHGVVGLLEQAIRSETAELRAEAAGDCSRVPEELPAGTRRSIDDALAETADGDRLLLNVAFNYAGQTELVDAFRRLAEQGIHPARSTRDVISGCALHLRACPIPTW